MQLNARTLLDILPKKFFIRFFFVPPKNILHLPLMINELSFKKKLFKYLGINADNEA